MVIGELVTAACVATDVTSSIRVTTGTIAVPTSIGSTPGVAGALQVSTVSVTVPVVSGAGTTTVAGTSYAMMMAGNRRKPGKFGQFKGRDALRAENKMARDAAKAEGLTKDQRSILHDAISGRGLSYHEIREIAGQIKKGNF